MTIDLDKTSWEISTFSGEKGSVLSTLKTYYSLPDKEKTSFRRELHTRYKEAEKAYKLNDHSSTFTYLISGHLPDHDRLFSPLGSVSSFLRWKFIYKQIFAKPYQSCV